MHPLTCCHHIHLYANLCVGSVCEAVCAWLYASLVCVRAVDLCASLVCVCKRFISMKKKDCWRHMHKGVRVMQFIHLFVLNFLCRYRIPACYTQSHICTCTLTPSSHGNISLQRLVIMVMKKCKSGSCACNMKHAQSLISVEREDQERFGLDCWAEQRLAHRWKHNFSRLRRHGAVRMVAPRRLL